MNWYPNNPGSSTGEYATYDMTFRIPQGMKIAATGIRVSESNEGGQNVSVWKSGGPGTAWGWLRSSAARFGRRVGIESVGRLRQCSRPYLRRPAQGRAAAIQKIDESGPRGGVLNPARESHKHGLRATLHTALETLQWIRELVRPCSDDSSALVTGRIFNTLL